MARPANPVLDAMNVFEIDGYTPFMRDPSTPTGLLQEAHGLTKVLACAFSDSGQLVDPGLESELNTVNPNFIASALNGIGSLIAMAMFMQEENS